MRKRRNPASRPSVYTEIPSPVEANARQSGKPSDKNRPNPDGAEFLVKVLSGVLVPLIVAAVTLFAAAWQFNAATDRADRVRFIDSAMATAQETSVLLDEGYNELEKLLNATDSHGWKVFSKGAFHDYMEFRKRWRQRAVSEHFKLARYFGRDLADQLIHTDEIDLHRTDNLASPNPCTPPGTEDNFDIDKMTFQTWCTIVRIPLLQDAIDDERTTQSTNELFDLFQKRRAKEVFAKKLLNHYEKAMVGYLGQLNERLSQLGQPQVTVVVRPKGASTVSH